MEIHCQIIFTVFHCQLNGMVDGIVTHGLFLTVGLDHLTVNRVYAVFQVVFVQNTAGNQTIHSIFQSCSQSIDCVLGDVWICGSFFCVSNCHLQCPPGLFCIGTFLKLSYLIQQLIQATQVGAGSQSLHCVSQFIDRGGNLRHTGILIVLHFFGGRQFFLESIPTIGRIRSFFFSFRFSNQSI